MHNKSISVYTAPKSSGGHAFPPLDSCQHAAGVPARKREDGCCQPAAKFTRNLITFKDGGKSLHTELPCTQSVFFIQHPVAV